MNPAELYNNILVPAIFEPWANMMTHGINTNDHVLDVGCGTGVIARRANERLNRTGSITGADLSQEMLNVASAVSSNTINWKKADITDLPFDDQQFDIVICQQIMQFVPDKQKAISECFRVLKPNGKLVIAVWKSTDYSPGWKALQDSLSEIIGEPYLLPPFAFDKPDDLVTFTKNAGFDFIDITHITKQTHFNDSDDFIDGVVGGSQNMLGKLADVTGTADSINIIKQKMKKKLATHINSNGLTFDQANNVLSATKPSS
ncbi:MAG: methyltransferase domain-containing protein [Cycloclasticus sp.]|nr:methyltransferase domain-containing protein [Cycloclasticus sp.]